MDDIYKLIVNEIAKPITALNKYQIGGVIERLSRGSMEDRLCCESLMRLNRYIELTLQLNREMHEFANELKNEQTSEDIG